MTRFSRIASGHGYDVAKKLAVEFRQNSNLRRISIASDAPIQRTRACMTFAKLHF
jgi:hypothetical protein